MNSLITHPTISYSTNYVTKMQEERIVLQVIQIKREAYEDAIN